MFNACFDFDSYPFTPVASSRADCTFLGIMSCESEPMLSFLFVFAVGSLLLHLRSGRQFLLRVSIKMSSNTHASSSVSAPLSRSSTQKSLRIACTVFDLGPCLCHSHIVLELNGRSSWQHQTPRESYAICGSRLPRNHATEFDGCNDLIHPKLLFTKLPYLPTTLAGICEIE